MSPGLAGTGGNRWQGRVGGRTRSWRYSGKRTAEVIRKHGISEQTFYRWKKMYGGVDGTELAKLKKLEDENRRLKQLAGDQALALQIMREELNKKGLGLKPVLAQLQARGVSRRRACKALRFSRSSACYVSRSSPVNETIRCELRMLACRHRRYGSPRLHALTRRQGYAVNHKRVQRLYRECGLMLPRRRPRRKHPAPVESRAIEAGKPNEVWSCDFVHERTKLKLLVLVDEYSRECLEIRVEKRLRGQDVLETLDEVMTERGAPNCIRSDNGSEFKNKALRKWLAGKGVQPIYADPGSPWQNGYLGSLNGKLRDECLNEELFFSLAEAQTVMDWWRQVYNEVRPQMAPGLA